MATQDPDLAEVIEAGIETHMAGFYTMLVGRVEAYDKDSQTADVQPLQANVYVGDDDKRYAERLPVHTNVPVAFPVSGGYRIVWPLKAGDTVILHYSSRALSEVKASSGAESIPADDRRNHLSDPIAYPGGRMSALKYVPDGVMSLGADDNDAVIDIDIDNTEIRAGKGASQHTVMGENFLNSLNACLTTLDTLVLAIAAEPSVMVPYFASGSPASALTGYVTARSNYLGLISTFLTAILKVK